MSGSASRPFHQDLEVVFFIVFLLGSVAFDWRCLDFSIMD
jgi:hypothetical protein